MKKIKAKKVKFSHNMESKNDYVYFINLNKHRITFYQNKKSKRFFKYADTTMLEKNDWLDPDSLENYFACLFNKEIKTKIILEGLEHKYEKNKI